MGKSKKQAMEALPTNLTSSASGKGKRALEENVVMKTSKKQKHLHGNEPLVKKKDFQHKKYSESEEEHMKAKLQKMSPAKNASTFEEAKKKSKKSSRNQSQLSSKEKSKPTLKSTSLPAIVKSKRKSVEQETSSEESGEGVQPVVKDLKQKSHPLSRKKAINQESSSEDDSSESEEAVKRPALKATNTKLAKGEMKSQKGVTLKESLLEDSSDSDDSSDEGPKKLGKSSFAPMSRKGVVMPLYAQQDGSYKDESSDDSDDDQEVKVPSGPTKQQQIRAVPKISALPSRKQESSSDESSDSDESLDEENGKPAFINTEPAKKLQVKPVPDRNVVPSKNNESSCTDSDESSDEELEKPTLTKKKIALAKKPQPKSVAAKASVPPKKQESSSNESSSSDESSEEQEKPAVTKKKIEVERKQHSKAVVTKEAILPKKQESSSNESSSLSSSDESHDEEQAKSSRGKTKIIPVKNQQMNPVTAKKNAAVLKHKEVCFDEASDSEESSDEEQALAKPKVASINSDEESSSEESSDDEDVPAKVTGKVSKKQKGYNESSDSDERGNQLDGKKNVQRADKLTVIKAPTKKLGSSDEENTDSESNSDDECNRSMLTTKAGNLMIKSGAKVEVSTEDSDSSDEDIQKIKLKRDISNLHPKRATVEDKKTSDKSDFGDQPQKKRAKFESAKHINATSKNNVECEKDEENHVNQMKVRSRKSLQEENDANSTEAGSKSVFVRNLAWKVNEEIVEDFFKDAGEVHEVRLARSADGEFRGFGHIEFTSAEGAKKACEMSGEILEGRGIFVEFARDRSFESKPPREAPPREGGFGGRGAPRFSSDSTAFVKGFDKFQDEDSIRSSLNEFFSECSVQNIRIPIDRETGYIKGFAYIDFENNQGLSKAVELNGSNFNGRSLVVEAAGGFPATSSGGWRGRGDFGNSRGRGRGDFGSRGRGGRGRGGDGRGFGKPREKLSLSGTGKKITFGEE